MLWFYLSAFVILLGALVNAEAERGVKDNEEAYPEGYDRPILRSPEGSRSGI